MEKHRLTCIFIVYKEVLTLFHETFLLLQFLNPFKCLFQMTGNWLTRSANNSISNSSSGDLLLVYFVLFSSSSSLVFSLTGLPLNSSSCSLPAVNVGAWISCLEGTTRGVLWKKVGLQNTSGRLLLHVVDEEAAVDSHQADKTVFEKENSI